MTFPTTSAVFMFSVIFTWIVTDPFLLCATNAAFKFPSNHILFLLTFCLMEGGLTPTLHFLPLCILLSFLKNQISILVGLIGFAPGIYQCLVQVILINQIEIVINYLVNVEVVV